MGPMGPMMGGWQVGSGTVIDWTAPVVVLLLVLLLAVIALVVWRGSGIRFGRREPSPGETLRERYARGELTKQQYQEALVDLLQDRYVRGEIDLGEFETRLAGLLGEEQPRPAADRQEAHIP